MDKQSLIAELETEIHKNSSQEEQIFLKLLKQVWEIDWTVAPYDVWNHMIEYDIPYFKRFMDLDADDEKEEEQLIIDWVQVRTKLREKDTGKAWKKRVCSLIDQANQLRSRIRQKTK